jgi:tetratricopeptide (TPR) repeat protein
MWWWWATRPEVGPPPEVPANIADPEVREAIEAARNQLVADPRSADLWGRYGMVLRVHNFEGEADGCFAQAERLDPRDARWPYLRGLFAEVNQPDGVPRGLAYFRRALKVGHPKPEYESVLRLRLAEALFDRGQLDEADSLFRAELARDPASPRAAFGLGLVAEARGDVPAARERFAAVAGNPLARQRAATQLVALARRAGDAAAAAQLQPAANAPKDPDWPDPFVRECFALQAGLKARMAEVDALEREGRAQEAAQALARIAAKYPTPDVHLKLAAALGRIGDSGQAEQHLRECLRLDPESEPGHHLLGVTLFLRAGAKWAADPDAAWALFRESVGHFRKSLARKPDNAQGHQCLGQALFLLGERDEGVKELRLAVACRPDRYEGHLYLGEALGEIGDRDGAVKELRTAEQLAPPGDPRPRAMIEKVTAGKPR